MQQFLLGVDEAGRGPLAGPVAVGVVAVPHDFDMRSAFPGVADSKVLSEEKREELFSILEDTVAQGIVRYRVMFTSPYIIDTRGITFAVRRAVYKGVRELAPEAEGVHIKLDGLLRAHQRYSQETIIGGDATEPVISLASIAAKVSRDRLMKELSKKFPEYGFEQHKGYGTKAHYEAIALHGLCEVHRKTFCHV